MSKFTYNATVKARVDVTDTLSIFQIENDEPFPEFKPGQFTMIGLTPDAERASGSEPEEIKRKPTDEIIRRAYSMSSSPEEKSHYEVYVSFVKSGELSSRLFNLKPGDRLWNSGRASGLFTTQNIPENKGIVMFSTGTGIAPFVSIARHAKAHQQNRHLVVANGIDVSAQLGFKEELEGYCSDHFHYLPIVTFPDRDPDWKGLTGWVQDDIRNGTYDSQIGKKLMPEHFHVMLCGNPAMISAAIEALEDRGFKHGKVKDPEATIYTEEYW